MSLLHTANRRFFRRHPRHILLALIGIALGVAVMSGIELSTASLREALQLSLEAVVGKATHQIVAGAEGLDEGLYAELRMERGLPASAPVVEGYARYKDQTLRVLGIDPLAGESRQERFQQPSGARLTELLSEPDTALLSRTSAQRLGVRTGDRLPLRVAGAVHQVRILGLIEGEGEADPALEGLLLADIATAQEILRRVGRIDRIDLDLDGDPAAEARLRAALPPGALLRSAEGRSAATQRMTEAFATNLQALSTLAVLVGMFLIYNTVSFNLLQRRTLLASLRVLGATRGEILAEVLLEAALLGLAGAGLGLVLGLLAAQGLLNLMTRTVNDVYFVLTITHLFVSPWALLKGLVVGVAAALLAALPPALEAAWSRPAMALRRSVLERRTQGLMLRLSAGGAVLLALAYLLLNLPSGSNMTAGSGVLCLALGYALLAPTLLTGLLRGAARLGAGRLPPLPLLALRGLTAGLSRTGVAAAALCLSIAMGIGIGVMIHSFRGAVAQWLERLLPADLYIALPDAPGRSGAPLPSDLPERARTLPGVAAIGTALRTTVETPFGSDEMLVFRPADADRPNYRFKGENADRAWRDLLRSDGVALSEPYASRHGLKAGDTLTLHTPTGPVDLPVRGIFFDYRSDQGIILMHRPLYERLWHDSQVSSLALHLEPGADLQAVREAAQRLLSDEEQQIGVRSNREIRTASLALFDRTFTVTQVLRLQAVAVAFIGVLSALLALQAERGRELAMLRSIGFTPGQVQALVLVQSGLLGLCAGLLALPLGWLVGDALVRVVNRQAFGWSMDLTLPPGAFAEAMLLALAASLLAGIHPARRAARTPPAAALREE